MPKNPSATPFGALPLEATHWVLVLNKDDAHSLAGLRTSARLVCLFDGDLLWLRGELENALAETLRFPAIERYTLDREGNLTPLGKKVPTRSTPRGDWIPMNAALDFLAPHIETPEPSAKRSELRMGRTSEMHEAAGVVCQWEDWSNLATTGPSIRLKQWRFATTAMGPALVMGTPIPSLPGIRVARMGSILCPLGWEWRPKLPPKDLECILRLAKDELALLMVGDEMDEGERGLNPHIGENEANEQAFQWERIYENDFVPASRSSVRATDEKRRALR